MDEIKTMFTRLTAELLDLRSLKLGDAPAPFAVIEDCCSCSCCCCCCWVEPPC